MKKTLVSIFLTPLLISTLYLSSTFAQDYSKLNLPEAAKLRLGKGWISGNIEYSPNGHRVAVASSIGIWIYNANTFAEVALLTGHTGPVRSVAFSPDSKKLVSGGDDGTARLWDVKTGQLLRTYEGQAVPVKSVAFSPDGKTIATGGDDEDVILWATDTGQLLHTLTLRSPGTFYILGGPDPINSVAFSPDGSKLANTNGSYIFMWDVTTGKELMRFTDTSSSDIYSVKFSSDGITLVSGSTGGKVQLWGARTGKLWQTLSRKSRYNYTVNSVDFSPDGKILASGGDNHEVDFWDASTGEHLRTLQGHTSPVLGVSFSPNRRTLASVSGTEIRFWNTETGRQKHIITGHTWSVYSVALSPDGSRIASGAGDGSIQLWNPRSGQPLKTLKGHTKQVDSVAFSPNGKTLASGSRDTTIRLWDVSTGTNRQTLVGHTNTSTHVGSVNSILFSRDGKTLVSAGNDNTIRLWDVNTGQLNQTIWGGGVIRSLSLSPDGQTFVSAATGALSPDNRDRTAGVQLWHLRTGRRLKILLISKIGSYEYRSIQSAAFSPDGSKIVGGVNNEIWFWDSRSGEHLRKLTGHSVNVRRVAFSPDGKTLLSIGNQEIRLWDVDTGLQKDTFSDHTGFINDVAFAPDGNTLVSGSSDGTVLLWQLTPSGPQTPKTILTVDVNTDGKVNKTDLLRVVKALGKKTTRKIRVDVNADGVVDVADLLLVIEHLDNPEDAAAPANREVVASLSPTMLSVHLDLLRAQNDGTLTYAQAIGFLESLLVVAKPGRTVLLANYPNPFNPETWIPYQLAEPADVTLRIYALDGRLIRTLALGHQPAGMYHSKNRAMYWDGRNQVAEQVASGVYFYTITAGDFAATRKMFILK